MLGSRSDTMADAAPTPAPVPRVVAVQLVILLALCAAVFHRQFGWLESTIGNSEFAHALAAPVIILVLFLFRRPALGAARSRGSALGFVIVLLSLLLYAVSTWPFNYEYPRRAAMVAAIAGVLMAVFGWGVLRLSLPMLLVLLLAIPVGMRIYARLIITPETVTLSAVRATLDLLPGVFVDLVGPDFSYFGRRGTGTIALGESMRGASLLLSYLTIGVLAIFTRIRPLWQLAFLGAATIPIVLFCNYFRLVLWGVITIYAGAHPLSPLPRAVASVTSLVLAYALFMLATLIAAKILTEPEGTGDRS